MAPNDSRVEVFYDVRAISPPPLRLRIPRRQQTAGVRRLLAEMSARAPGPRPDVAQRRSISHSRGIVAAAIARDARIGIDVEYMCPRRDISAILGLFLGTMDKPVSLSGFYRAWTFGEAYFKAFGRLPGEESLIRVIEHHAKDGVYRMVHHGNAAIGVLHSKAYEEFALTLVWETNDTANPALLAPKRML